MPPSKKKLKTILGIISKIEDPTNIEHEKDAAKRAFKKATGGKQYTEETADMYKQWWEEASTDAYPGNRRKKGEKSPEDSEIRPDQDELDAIISIIDSAQDETSSEAQRNSARETFKNFTGKEYTAENINKYRKWAGLDEILPASAPPPKNDGDLKEKEDRPIEKMLSREERRQTLGKIIIRTLSTLTGLRWFKTLVPLWRSALLEDDEDSWRLQGLRDEREILLTILSDIEGAQQNIDNKPHTTYVETAKEMAAREKREKELKNKEAALQDTINDLIERGIIDKNGADIFHTQLQDILNTARNKGDGIQLKTERRIIKIFNAHIIRKADKRALTEFLKQTTNLGSILLGLQTARALSYAGLSVYQRVQRRLTHHERLIREGKEKEIRSVWQDICKDLTVHAGGEMWEGVKNILFTVRDLSNRRKISKTEWITQTQSAGKALRNIMIFMGMFGIAGAEIQKTGSTLQIDNLLHNSKEKGFVQTIADNWLLNADRATGSSISGLHKIFHGIEPILNKAFHGTGILDGESYSPENTVSPIETARPKPHEAPPHTTHEQQSNIHTEERPLQVEQPPAARRTEPAPIREQPDQETETQPHVGNKTTYVPEPPHIQESKHPKER